MKKFVIAALLLAGSMSAFAEVKNDTLSGDNTKVRELIADETTNSKGKPVTKYYFLYDDELISTSKSVAEKYNLCKRHGAKCLLSIVVNRKSNRKRIILK